MAWIEQEEIEGAMAYKREQLADASKKTGLPILHGYGKEDYVISVTEIPTAENCEELFKKAVSKSVIFGDVTAIGWHWELQSTTPVVVFQNSLRVAIRSQDVATLRAEIAKKDRHGEWVTDALYTALKNPQPEDFRALLLQMFDKATMRIAEQKERKKT